MDIEICLNRYPEYAADLRPLLGVATGLARVRVPASADSLPGDLLDPVKRVSQRAQLALMFNPARRRPMSDHFETQQRVDVQTALGGRRQAAVELRGVSQHREETLWIVGGLPVARLETTVELGRPYLGAMVSVEAYLPGRRG
ncbi:hypothetical protein ACFLT5_03615 [Chloroflexota bacterium]